VYFMFSLKCAVELGQVTGKNFKDFSLSTFGFLPELHVGISVSRFL
jgi:hypothetical protein